MSNNKKAQTIACDLCGRREAQIKYITRTYGKGANLLVIENVPVVVCPSCGESYLTVETLHEIERIKLHRRKPRQAEECGCGEFYLNTEEVEHCVEVRNDVLMEMGVVLVGQAKRDLDGCDSSKRSSTEWQHCRE